MTKRAANGRRTIKFFCGPTSKKIGTTEVLTNLYVTGRTKKVGSTKQVCSLPTSAHFHSDKIPNIRTSPLSLFVLSSEEKTTRDSPEFEASVSTSRHGDISRHKTEDAEGLQTPHMRYLERREMMFTWVAKRNTF